MTELLISEITLMQRGLCVIGLERSDGHFRSLRPIPPNSNAWKQFPYRRADKVAFDLSSSPGIAPHVEDRLSAKDRKSGSVTENELVDCLRKAETASSIKDLFGCRVHLSKRGGLAVYVDPSDAIRSICGCEIESISFSFRFYPEAIRAALALKSGETLDSLPVVDCEWREFAGDVAKQVGNQIEDCFDSFVKKQLLPSPIRFARIGIARPDREGLCWLMLDSLFPLPKKHWLKELK